MMRTRHTIRIGNAARGRRGTLLIIVLVVALGLVSITLYFADTMILEYKAADNSESGIAAAQASDGARRYLLYMLKNMETPGQMPDTTLYPAEWVPIGDEAQYWLIGRDPNETQATDMPTFALIDEGAKLNLNTSISQEMLELLPGMIPEVAAAILDWRDSDDELRDYGAESETYMMFTPPYYAKNGSFESVEELRLVNGIDWTYLYGEDANRNGILDPNENDGTTTFPEDNQDGVLDPGLLEYVTVWSRESNKDAEGSTRTNIATSDTQALQQVISDTLGDQRAQEVIQAVRNQLPQMRSLLQFYIASGLTTDEMSQIEDKLMVGADEFPQGKVNVNSAPAAVLACIPGIGEELAPQLVSYRQGRTLESLASISWVADVLEDEAAIQAGPYLTTRTYVYSADVVALGRMGRGMRRDLYVIDTAEGEPRVVYRRDLSRLGWPLGIAMRDQIRAEMAGEEGPLGSGLSLGLGRMR